jgi:RecA-superfamily ATPases implicated in signal transduction
VKRPKRRYVVKSVDDVQTLLDVLRTAIKDLNASRVVVDSVTTLYITKPVIARSVVLQLKKLLSGIGCTSLLVSQVSITEEVLAVLELSMRLME